MIQDRMIILVVTTIKLLSTKLDSRNANGVPVDIQRQEMSNSSRFRPISTDFGKKSPDPEGFRSIFQTGIEYGRQGGGKYTHVLRQIGKYETREDLT